MLIQNCISQNCILKLKYNIIFVHLIITLKYLFFILIFTVSFTIVNAQEPYAIHLSKADGLPSNSVYNVFQDSKGFIWLATNAGLTRYDGFEFKTYQCNEQTSTSGSSIKEDAFGRIWYENFDGYLYYVENDTLKALQQNTPIGYIPIGITKKHLFVMQKNGVDVYDIRSLKKIKTIEISTLNAQHSAVNQTYFYCIINQTLHKIDDQLNYTSNNFLNKITETTKQIYLTNNKIYVVSKHNEKKHCYIFDDKLSYLETIKIQEPEFIQGSDYISDQFWIHTPKGTFAYSVTNTNEVQSYFKDKSISCVIKDRQNNFWFSTTNEGLYLVPDINNSVFQLNGYLPNKIVETKHDFFLATKKNELIRCDKSFNIKDVVNQKTNNSEIYYLNYDSTKNNLFYSSNGFTHIADLKFSNPLFYDIAVKEITKIDESYYAVAVSGFCGLFSLNNTSSLKNSVWDNCFVKNKQSLFLNISNIIDNVRGKSLAFNPKTNSIYFATNIGLFKCTPTNNTEIKLGNQPFYASKIIHYQNNLYALSTKGNLYKIFNDKNFVLLNKSYGIKDFDIKFIKQFDDKLIFVSQNFVHQLNLQNNQLSTINININAYEINDVLLKDNVLFLITNRGIIKSTFQNKINKKEGATLQINELIVNNKKYNPHTKNQFDYNQNDIIINFSLLDFGSSTQNQLYYKINNDNWQSVLNETRVLQFASLAPGDYNLIFKLNDQILSSKIVFTIETPFWQTAWFTLLCILLTLLIGFIYYREQVNKLRTKNKLLEDKNILLQEKIELEHSLNKSVLTSIKSQMNPHFFYNALNTIQAYIFTNDKAKANNYLAKFSKLTRVILEQSEKETILLGEEIESLTLYLELEKMRFNTGFEYHIEIKTTTHKDSLEFPPMLIQPYVENAVKHGLLHKEGDKKLMIIFEEHADHIFITIDDNGIGRKRSGELNKIKNEKYQSFSTQANEKRLEILNRQNDKIAVKIIDKLNGDGSSNGTKITLTIPIN